MTQITICEGDKFLIRGQRIEIAGHRAVIRSAEGMTLNIAYRDAWYWQLTWRLEDHARTFWRFLTVER